MCEQPCVPWEPKPNPALLSHLSRPVLHFNEPTVHLEQNLSWSVFSGFPTVVQCGLCINETPLILGIPVEPYKLACLES